MAISKEIILKDKILVLAATLFAVAAFVVACESGAQSKAPAIDVESISTSHLLVECPPTPDGRPQSISMGSYEGYPQIQLTRGDHP